MPRRMLKKLNKIYLYPILFVCLQVNSVLISFSQCIIFNCPPDTTFYTDPGTCNVVSDTLIPELSGCSGSLAYVLSGATTGTGDTIIGKTFNLGLTNINYSIGTDNCSFKVLVKDNEPPEITGHNDISSVANPGDCGAQVYFDEISVFDNSSLWSGSIIQTHDFNIGSKEELTGLAWQLNGFDVFEDDTCLKSNALSGSGSMTVITPFYEFENGDSIFFTHWTTGYSDDSLIVSLIDSNNDTIRIFEYECVDNNVKHNDTVEISGNGFFTMTAF